MKHIQLKLQRTGKMDFVGIKGVQINQKLY